LKFNVIAFQKIKQTVYIAIMGTKIKIVEIDRVDNRIVKHLLRIKMLMLGQPTCCHDWCCPKQPQ
jgi:hypothetical protein